MTKTSLLVEYNNSQPHKNHKYMIHGYNLKIIKVYTKKSLLIWIVESTYFLKHK